MRFQISTRFINFPMFTVVYYKRNFIFLILCLINDTMRIQIGILRCIQGQTNFGKLYNTYTFVELIIDSYNFAKIEQLFQKNLIRPMMQLNCTQKFFINILKQGHVPEHISFIMDGNRRYAMSKNKQTYKGHQDGKQSLKTYLLYCLQIGVKQASFFCFSIENFNRSQIQLNKLMELVLNTFDELSEVSQFVLKKNVQVRIIGKVDLFRKDVAECLKNVQQKTKNNNKMTVNLCFAYDSIDEINSAIEKAKKAPNTQDQISFGQVYNNLMINRPVDILVRTSNQSRLSNFMLMQNGYSLMCILKQNWPQINLFSLIKIILHYNLNYKAIQKKKYLWLKSFQTQQDQRENNQQQKLL